NREIRVGGCLAHRLRRTREPIDAKSNDIYVKLVHHILDYRTPGRLARLCRNRRRCSRHRQNLIRSILSTFLGLPRFWQEIGLELGMLEHNLATVKPGFSRPSRSAKGYSKTRGLNCFS